MRSSHQSPRQARRRPWTPASARARSGEAAWGSLRRPRSPPITVTVRRPDSRGLVNPSLGAVAVADAPPLLELADHFHRHRPAQEHPGDRVAEAGPGAQVRPVGGEADEPRQRQAAGPRFGGGGVDRREQACEKDAKDAAKHGASGDGSDKGHGDRYRPAAGAGERRVCFAWPASLCCRALSPNAGAPR